MLDKKETTQLRDSLIEEFNGLRKDKNSFENFETQDAVLLGQINILTHILKDGYFNPTRGKVIKAKTDDISEKMYTNQKL